MENSTTSNGNSFIYHNPDFWESPQTDALDKALVEFNSKFKSVKRDEVVSVSGRKDRKFASLDEIMIEIRPILADCKLYVQQPITGGKITTVVRHESGQFRAFSMPMVEWQGQGTTAIQNLGGAITYMRRYSLGAALALATEEDDDAQSTGKLDIKKGAKQEAAAAPKIDETIVDAWNAKMNECKTDEDFQRVSKEVGEMEEGPVKKFVRATMSARLDKLGMEYNKGTKIFQKKAATTEPPTEKQA